MRNSKIKKLKARQDHICTNCKEAQKISASCYDPKNITDAECIISAGSNYYRYASFIDAETYTNTYGEVIESEGSIKVHRICERCIKYYTSDLR